MKDILKKYLPGYLKDVGSKTAKNDEKNVIDYLKKHPKEDYYSAVFDDDMRTYSIVVLFQLSKKELKIIKQNEESDEPVKGYDELVNRLCEEAVLPSVNEPWSFDKIDTEPHHLYDFTVVVPNGKGKAPKYLDLSIILKDEEFAAIVLWTLLNRRFNAHSFNFLRKQMPEICAMIESKLMYAKDPTEPLCDKPFAVIMTEVDRVVNEIIDSYYGGKLTKIGRYS